MESLQVTGLTSVSNRTPIFRSGECYLFSMNPVIVKMTIVTQLFPARTIATQEHGYSFLMAWEKGAIEKKANKFNRRQELSKMKKYI